MGSIIPGDHKAAMQHALGLADKSPPKPTNFRVGALIVRLSDNTILAEGYTLELPGNTHAEECCLLKLANEHNISEEGLADVMKGPHALYTTVEPCFKRLSGKLPCVERVLRQSSWISEVYVGVLEPETFVGQNTGLQSLKAAGVGVHHVDGLEEEILKIATAGHTAA
ncbi:cytidine deaminase-like protein [Dactylonectria estremocensis]|uniref:Cytidine deaminase-like protein n=1 Tax=Dactylonectria estremocensis TaxID=1079267 RepID=A0A9P9FBC3_9HYPO|nr:cytidine deaminase-like protein [Dactylonectria estremocensis]